MFTSHQEKNITLLTLGVIGNVLEGEIGASHNLDVRAVNKLAASDLRALRSSYHVHGSGRAHMRTAASPGWNMHTIVLRHHLAGQVKDAMAKFAKLYKGKELQKDFLS